MAIGLLPSVAFRGGIRAMGCCATLPRPQQRVTIRDGLCHGYFEFALTCEVIGQERRRLTLRAGKSYQFVIAKEDCVRSAVSPTLDSSDGSDTHAA